MTTVRVARYGPHALLVDLPDLVAVQAADRALRAAALPGVVEVVPAARTVLVRFACPEDVDEIAVRATLRAAAERAAAERAAAEGAAAERATEGMATEGGDEAGAADGSAAAEGVRGAGTLPPELPDPPDPPDPPVVLPVRYDGPDLTEVARRTGLTEPEVVDLHRGGEYRVAFGGFMPGFAYLTGLAPRLHLPRLATPRPRVPAGSVAVAGEFTAVYPGPTPGGWWLLGTCDLVLFDPDREPPALLTPGTRVRFEAVHP